MKPVHKAFLIAALCVGAAGVAHAAASFVANNQPTGYVGRPDVTNHSVVSGNETVFVGDYEKQYWTGNLNAYPIDAAGNVDVAAERWSGGAAAHINDADPNARIIVTMKSDGSRIAFRWTELSSTQQGMLGNNSVGPKMVNFIRGDHTYETPDPTKFRQRFSVMGDVVHSEPLYVKGTARSFVYVGANDGMLHVIDAQTGEEEYAYIPSMLISKLSALAADPYVHNSYVDGSIEARKVSVAGVDKTVLVGTLGAGGKGLFALDITDQEAASETAAKSKILWEITNTSINNVASTAYQNLGDAYSRAVIGKLSNGKYVAITGNGYNNTGNGRAVLYAIDIANGAKVFEIDTGIAGAGGPNGLSSPAVVDVEQDGALDYAYAGDIDGNLWKFDLRNPAALPAPVRLHATGQAITGAPAVSLHPLGGYLVAFTTGRILTAADESDNSVHYAYGIWDQAPAANTQVLNQTLTQKTYTSGSVTRLVRISSNNSIDWAIHKGWRTALPAGERSVGDGGFIDSERYRFNAVNPTITSPDRGSNWYVELNYTNGGTYRTVFMDLNNDGKVNDQDRLSNAGTPISGAAGIPLAKYIDSGVNSHPIMVDLAVLSTPIFNHNPDTPPIAIAPPGDPGIQGGHFDFDIFYSCSGSLTAGSRPTCSANTHVHEYDDKYDVVGVNMLNASNNKLNLLNAIPNTATKFKVIMANQSLSKLVTFSMGGAPHSVVTGYMTSAGASLASLPTYTRNTIGTLEVRMPYDVIARNGLHPTTTGCVHGNNPGAYNEWRNGALTIQVIKDTTPDSDIRLNVAGDASKGYVLKSASNLLAEYTIFRHKGTCYANPGWTANLPPDPPTSPSKNPPRRAPGSADPLIGAITGTVVSDTTTTSGGVTIRTIRYSNGTVITETSNTDGTIRRVVRLPDGTTIDTTIGGEGTVDGAGNRQGGGLETRNRVRTGRISWSEKYRE